MSDYNKKKLATSHPISLEYLYLKTPYKDAGNESRKIAPKEEYKVTAKINYVDSTIEEKSNFLGFINQVMLFQVGYVQGS